MDFAFLLAWLHLVTTVFLVGYALFWTIVCLPHPDRARPADASAFLERVKRTRWPPFGPLRLPLPWLGWIGLLVLGATGVLGLHEGSVPNASGWWVAGAVLLLHAVISLRPRPVPIVLFLIALLASVALAVNPTFSYRGVVLSVHLFAVSLWLGHMFFWSLVVGPLCKRVQPPEFGERLREASHRHGALGGAALMILFPTGTMLLFEHAELPGVFSWKLALVGAMVLYQMFVGHRRAPRLIYANMLVALTILALSVVLVHGAA